MFTITSFLFYISLFLLSIFALIWLYFKSSFNYWRNRNVPFLHPSFPLGNINLSFYRKYGQELSKLYTKFRATNSKYAGFYMFAQPVFLPIHPDIVKEILTKAYTSFDSRGIYINEKADPLTPHLFALSGKQWKSMRSKLTPTFSSGKIKMMSETMIEVGKQLTKAIVKCSENNQPIDIRELCGRFSTDVVCTCGFGIECNSLNETENELRKISKSLFENNLMHSAKVILGITFPKVLKLLKIPFIRPDFTKFFINAIKNVVSYREENSVERPDFMNLLIRLKNNRNLDDGRLKEGVQDAITLEELMAQCFAFYVAGYETSSSAMGYCLFELAQNIDIQERLRNEILSVLERYEGKITYDAIGEMTYLNQVVYETLRKYPSLVVLNRKCTQDYQLSGSDLVIQKGTTVVISCLGLHHDPEYFPEPDIFDPERFTPQETAKRHPYCFLPFGEGPKNCIGLKFGLLQTKIGIISVIKDHLITLDPSVKLPLDFITEIVILSHYGRIYVRAEKIKK